MIRLQILSLFLCLSLGVAKADQIQEGMMIEQVRKLMSQKAYQKTMLAMEAREGSDLEMWSVGDGVLIAVFSTDTKKVQDLSFFLCDERPRAVRKFWDFPVRSFDTITEELTIKVKTELDG